MKNIALVLILLTTITYANPIAISPGTTPIELFALLSEGLVVSLLLTNHNFYFLRIFMSWFVITFVSYILFMWILSVVLINLLGQEWVVPILIFVELLIIWVEAKIIIKVATFKIFRKSKELISMKDAYIISLIGNLTSIAMGFIFMWSN